MSSQIVANKMQTQEQKQEVQEKQYHQYFSSRPMISITMPTAKRIRFVGGMYVTDKQDEIDFLNSEIKAGNQMIFIDANKRTVGEAALDPLAAIKKKAVEDYLANIEKAKDPNNDMGNYAAEAVAGLVTSRNIAATATAVSSPAKR